MRLALCALAAANLFAQLPFNATYDAGRTTRLEGAVTRIEWVNPRAYLFLDTPSGNWAVEVGNPLDLETSGWTRNRVRIGDTLLVQGNPAHGQSKIVFARSVTRGGEQLFVLKPPAASPNGAVPRWPNSHPRLGAAPGQTGYWNATAGSLTESPVRIDPSGLLADLADSTRVAPLQSWAQALYDYRQRNLLRDDPAARCIPPGGPRAFQTPHGFQFIEQPDLGRILVLFGGGNRNWRIIYTDGRPLAPPDEVVLGFYGTSVGRWDGDTLIVDSSGYNETFWFSNGGLPHTEALRLTERFTRTNLNTLRYEVTVNDPRAYTRPWTAGWNITWVPGKEIEEFFCEENAESTFERE